MTTEKIEIPSAAHLDTITATDGWRTDLYFVPALEDDDGVPAVVTHVGVGNIGTPGRAYHGRQRYIGSYEGRVVGASVVRALEALEPVLLAWSSAYQGADWDGSNMIGRWSDAEEHRYQEPHDLEVQHYHDAADWFGEVRADWEQLAAWAGVDPDRALGSDWIDVAEEVAARLEAQQDEPVAGTADYCLDAASDYRDSHEDAA